MEPLKFQANVPEWEHKVAFCSSRREEEAKYLEKVEETFGLEYKVTRLPLMSRPVKGVESLTELGELIYPVERKSCLAI